MTLTLWAAAGAATHDGDTSASALTRHAPVVPAVPEGKRPQGGSQSSRPWTADRGCPLEEKLLPQLVAQLREHRARLREEWVGRIRDAHLLEAMTQQRWPRRPSLSTTTTSRSWRPAASRRSSTTPTACPN